MDDKTHAVATDLGHGALTRQEGEDLRYEVRDAQPQRARTRAHVYVSVLGWLLCIVVAAGIYTNVIADPAIIRERAASLARRHAGCGERCRILQMQERRTVFGYRADYEIEGNGSVHVTCRRAAVVFGDHECQTP